MRKGDVYVVTRGEYSDYGIFAIVEACVDFSWDAETAAELARVREVEENHYNWAEKVLDAFIARGLVRHAPRIVELDWGLHSAVDCDAETKLALRYR